MKTYNEYSKEFSDHTMAKRYVELINLIHKKIEKYDDGIWFHTFPQHTTSEVLVAELKSLLGQK